MCRAWRPDPSAGVVRAVTLPIWVPLGFGELVRRPSVAPRSFTNPLTGRQLSSRTLTVSTCCWNVATFPSAKVKTWAIFTFAGSPEVLCFQL